MQVSGRLSTSLAGRLREGRAGATALAVVLAATLLGVTASAPPGLTEVTATAALRLRGAGLPGSDISWPQCPRRSGGYALPAPPRVAQFVVVGLTAGRPYTTNPCLSDQVTWDAFHAVPAQAYLIVGWPATDQARAYGGSGPWPPSTQLNRLRNAGYAQARYALSSWGSAGFSPPMVWLDVEPIDGQPWPAGTAERRAANRAVLLGVMRGLADAGVPYGVYSYAGAWQDITGNWQLPEVPVWATAGRSGRARAVAMCRHPGFSGGPVLISQWYDDERDSDISCQPFRLAPLPAPLPDDAQ